MVVLCSLFGHGGVLSFILALSRLLSEWLVVFMTYLFFNDKNPNSLLVLMVF